MKRNGDIFIENVLKDKNKIEENIQKMVEDVLAQLDNENRMNNKIYDPDKKEYNNDLDPISSTVSKAGKFITMGGLMTGGGAIFSVFLFEALGGLSGTVGTILFGVCCTSVGTLGLGLIPFIGIGAYSFFKNKKYKKIKKFYENLDNNNMKIEREIRQHVINKIYNYFIKPISNNYLEIQNKINEINNQITEIVTIFISIDNSKLDLTIDSIKKSICKKDEQLTLLDKNRKLVVKNYIKITQVLFQTIMISTTSDINKSFDEGISLFKELIRCFGPQRIDNKNEKQVDYLMENILLKMKEILNIKMKNSFDNFKPNTFNSSFTTYLKDKYREKQEQEEFLNENEEDFINKCNYCIVEFISSKSKNWGIAVFYMFFTNIIGNICLHSKEDNYKKMVEKLNNLD